MKKKIKTEKDCTTCNKRFTPKRDTKGRFCSLQCYWSSLRTLGDKPDCIDCGGQLSAHHCNRCGDCHGKYLVGENHGMWKGGEVSYRSLHKWVERQLGKPKHCSECGKIGYGRQIHWSNVSGEYKRDVSDWQRLCAKCHKAFDLSKV